ncbi:hypothetical protein K440DRAFT_19197, partial [Wilcoxina mikolae CBS 423.85]
MQQSQKKPKKRDKFFGFFKSGRSSASNSLKSTAASSSTSVLPAGGGPNSTAPPTRASTPPTQPCTTTPGPSTETQSEGASAVIISNPNPTNQPGPLRPSPDNDLTRTDTPKGGKEAATLSAASNIQAPSLWDMAIDELSQQDRTILSGFGIERGTQEIGSNLACIRDEMEGILRGNQDKHWQFTFRNETIVMRDVGRKILQWVDKFKEIGDIIIQFDPGHAALPWAGFRFLLKICINKKETANAILVGLEKIACLIDRCTMYELLYIGGGTEASRNLEKSIIRLYAAILGFVAEAIKKSNDNTIKSAFTVDDLSRYLGDIEDLEKTVGQDAAVSTAASTQTELSQLRKLLDDLNVTTSRFGPQLDDIQLKLEGVERSKILEWISKIPYSSHHKEISERRLDDTGRWLFEKEEYRRWKSSSASTLLLLRGIPGAGKTFCASKFIDSYLSNSAGEKMAYFYCNKAEEDRREPKSILNTLVQQLSLIEDNLLRPIVDIYLDRKTIGQLSSSLSLTESKNLLVQLSDIYPRTTICIDARDEVDKEKRIELLESLKYVINNSKNLVKIFATTRMDPDILYQFKIFPRIELQPDDNVNDINQFIETKVDGVIKDGLLLGGDVRPELKDEICVILRNRSKGMFQLAALQVTFLCEMCTEEDVRSALKDIPDTLKNAYDEIYNRILMQKRNAPRLALKAFRWIQSSYTPLNSNTLLDAISIEVDERFSREHTIKANDLLQAC